MIGEVEVVLFFEAVPELVLLWLTAGVAMAVRRRPKTVHT